MHTLETADIHAIGQHVEQQVQAHWLATLEDHAVKLEDAYARGGDMAYGTYLGLLFRPINRELKAAGFTLEPDLPGDLDLSREWENLPDGSDNQRLMWSVLRRSSGEAVGALVVMVFHDHNGFRVPRAPGIVALDAADDEAVIAVLSSQHPEFAAAKPFTVEVAEYLAALEGHGQS